MVKLYSNKVSGKLRSRVFPAVVLLVSEVLVLFWTSSVVSISLFVLVLSQVVLVLGTSSSCSFSFIRLLGDEAVRRSLMMMLLVHYRDPFGRIRHVLMVLY